MRTAEDVFFRLLFDSKYNEEFVSHQRAQKLHEWKKTLRYDSVCSSQKTHNKNVIQMLNVTSILWKHNQVFDFELSFAEMTAIEERNKNYRLNAE